VKLSSRVATISVAIAMIEDHSIYRFLGEERKGEEREN
jgi:hypothetical protein